jgi:hypothetical protein
MQSPKKLLAVLLLDGHVICFVRDVQPPWRHEPLFGETWYPLSSDHRLAGVLHELDERINGSDQLAGFTLHLIYNQAALPWLADAVNAMETVKCKHWQILQWEPLRDRATLLTGKLPALRPSIDWLRQGLLAVLEATFNYQEDALAAERGRAEQEHAETLESLRTDRLRLEAEITTQREQLAALQRPAMDDVLTYLPALYRNVFGSIAPHDLALLAGSLQVPQIPSPWPDPAPDTLQALQARLRKLPQQRAGLLRDFCQQLPHKLELRPEMRVWLGEG